MKSKENFFKKYFYLLDYEIKKKIPLCFLLFFFTALINIFSLGLLGLFLKIVFVDSIKITSHNIIIKKLLVFINPKNLINILGIFLIIIFFLKSLFVLFSQKTINLVSTQYISRLKLKLINYYQNAGFYFHVTEGATQMLGKINLIDGFVNQVVLNVLNICFSLFLLVTVLGFLLVVCPIPTTILILIISLIFIFYFFTLKQKISEFGRIMHSSKSKAKSIVFNAFLGIGEIRVFGRENFFYQAFQDQTKIYEKYTALYQSSKLIIRQIIEPLTVMFLIILFLCAPLLKIAAIDIIPTLGMFAVACLRTLPVTSNLLGQLNTLHHNLFNADLLYDEFIKLQKEYIYISNHDNKLDFDTVDFNNIYFSYPNTNKQIFCNARLSLKKGETIGIIGVSGVGKTTLVNLILGLLKPDKGEIKINGSLFYDLRSWLNNLAYIPQTNFIINDTLKHNIALGVDDSAIDEGKLQLAIQQAQLTELVHNMESGVNTMIGEYGINLSGGQRQRVALARALFFDRSIIIMDEATSSLDTKTEECVIQAIKKLRGLKTIIIIAHRLTTLRYCDTLYKVEKGTIQKVNYDLIGA